MKDKIKIGWIDTGKNLYGGQIYNKKARQILSSRAELEEFIIAPERFSNQILSKAEIFLKLKKISGEKDLWVRDIISLSTMKFDSTKGKNLALIHHDDFSGYPLLKRLPLNFFWQISKSNLQNCEIIVTVSKFWFEHYRNLGFKNLKIIYNPFDINDYQISEQEVQQFLEKYNLKKKPLIYLGNCHPSKGIKQAYEALKDLDAEFVTSGYRNMILQAIHLQLSHRDYLKLLKASDIVLTMSLFNEGWCRTAHEAMLLGRPVIGSGKGGMRELLEGGGQFICEDFKDLKKYVERILSSKDLQEELSRNGKIFASQFTNEKFNNSWLELISEINQ